MAQKVITEYIDDIDGKTADGTVSFGYGGTSYEIDLSAANKAKLDKALAPYIEHGRKATNGTGKRGRRPRSQHSGDVRAWAKTQGITVSSRGRIPADVIAKYEAAH